MIDAVLLLAAALTGGTATPGAHLQLIAERPAREAAPASSPLAQAGSLGLPVIQRNEHFVSEGRQIRIEVMRPDDVERHEAILILHGASGIGDGTFYRGTAEVFAGRGYITFIPHYLEAPPAAIRAKGTRKPVANSDPKPDGDVRAGFDAQDHILRDALDYVARYANVDATRIGLFGLSLGGFHALTLSAKDHRIAAVVDMSGALPGNIMRESDHLAPTLALHGAKDRIVPVSRARSLAVKLKSRGIPHELMVYPDQGHFFRGRAQHDALRRSLAFFDAYLTAPIAGGATRAGARE